ncbi:unnamed protein product [Rodentolepis nana]|uniref:Sema domain-containing protein n=1 Tax=Rodentolepis nana TaxID=102285 RepID=A0A0R3THF0_RODNA|nr:unnamed protein product [Rodentolepis nana]
MRSTGSSAPTYQGYSAITHSSFVFVVATRHVDLDSDKQLYFATATGTLNTLASVLWYRNTTLIC